VAFSAGVDSTYLLKIASGVLGKNVLAITASSASFPKRELKEAIEFCNQNNISHKVIYSEELDIPGFSDNPNNRCYLCKKELFTKIWEIARAEGYQNVIEGSNIDDDSDYRPGLLAVSELGIKSPLREAGLNKTEIRELSRRLGLSTANKQSFACLSSRIPYGEEINAKKLEQIDEAEQFLLDMGFYQVRVRHHGELARIEVCEQNFQNFFNVRTRNEIIVRLKALGFTYICIDLGGYRTGSVNEVLI
jgi:uncharacterized protein